ncbi:hypothetical protein ABWED_0175 [Acinetobacter lwoffii]|nr:hypothetical protein ABEKA_0935 [Acinetobacter lwoffii]UVA99526.1 hypothetical protein ABWED_0175 [Acinetobacter lwoffii]
MYFNHFQFYKTQILLRFSFKNFPDTQFLGGYFLLNHGIIGTYKNNTGPGHVCSE